MSERPTTYDSQESRQGRVNRNWDELLQELRVTQTGIQLLAGFLLTLPFQDGQMARRWRRRHADRARRPVVRAADVRAGA